MAIQTDNFGMMENVSRFDFMIPQQQHPFDQVISSFGGGDQINHIIIYDQNQTSMDFCERQRLELEHLINLQYERLRIAVEEHRKQQTALLLQKYEVRARFLLKQKEEESVRTMNRKMELQNILGNLEAERQTWHQVARENEAMAMSLRDRIEELSADTAESCCLNATVVGEKARLCRCCNSRNSCVVILPCRHLCSCQTCELFLDSCPVCRIPKKDAIQALF